MKKILLTLIIFLSFFGITQTFAGYEYININTLSGFSKYNVNATLPTDYYEYRFTGNYNDLGDKSGLYFYYPEFNQYLSVYSYLPSYSPCEESFVYDYQVSQNRSRVVCYSSDYEGFNPVTFIPQNLYYRIYVEDIPAPIENETTPKSIIGTTQLSSIESFLLKVFNAVVSFLYTIVDVLVNFFIEQTILGALVVITLIYGAYRMLKRKSVNI